jgi:hypothetical protein
VKLPDLLDTVQIYPTYAGLVVRLAGQFSAARLEKGLVRAALRWVYGFGSRNEKSPAQHPSSPSSATEHDH